MGLFDPGFEFKDIFTGVEELLPMNIIMAMMIVMIAGVIWRYDKSGYALTAYLIMAGMLGGIAIAPPVGMFLYLMCAMGIGMVFYKLYENRSRY